jgi:DNA modification methylase
MVLDEIVDYFSQHQNTRKIPTLTKEEWTALISKYKKDDIRDSLARFIKKAGTEFPCKKINQKDAYDLFYDFYSTSTKNMYKDFDVVLERYEYKHKYKDNPLGVIEKTHYYNDVSNYFQQENRMKCGSIYVDSPMEIWCDETKLAKMNWHFWRAGVMEDDGINDAIFRAAFRLGTYTATQFKPSVAKAVYERHRAENVLDTSCGWGDRLAGFYGTHSTKLYVGCDPNPDVFEVYKKQCVEYEKIIGGKPKLIEQEDYFECHGKKTVKIWRKPSEDVEWSLYTDTFDLYFTSPPYFETEKYASDTSAVSDQSWARYNSFNNWKHDFFFKVTEMVWPTIKKNGFMMINIIEPRAKNGTRLNLCDDMVEHFCKLPQCNYIGKIGMRMMARPNTQELKGVFIEPIWVFRRSNSDYEFNRKLTLESVFQ